MAGEKLLGSEQYAERLRVSYGMFRKAISYKRGTLGTRGGTESGGAGLRELAEAIAEPSVTVDETQKYGPYERWLWSPRDLDAFEAEHGRYDGARGREGPRRRRASRPRRLSSVPDEEIAELLGSEANVAAAGLTSDEAEVLRLRLELDVPRGRRQGRKQQEVGEAMALSEFQVRVIEHSACKKVLAATGHAPANASRDPDRPEHADPSPERQEA